MRSVDSGFYKSKAWELCRKSYLSEHSLCERCYAKGYITPAKIVHHKIYLSEKNINDPSITLNFDNLEALCLECHNKEHFKSKTKRWSFEDGELVIKGQ